jgi:hypothetical protein
VERVTKIVPPPTPGRPYIHDPPTVVQHIRQGHFFPRPVLAISIPEWLVGPLKFCRFCVIHDDKE